MKNRYFLLPILLICIGVFVFNILKKENKPPESKPELWSDIKLTGAMNFLPPRIDGNDIVAGVSFIPFKNIPDSLIEMYINHSILSTYIELFDDTKKSNIIDSTLLGTLWDARTFKTFSPEKNRMIVGIRANIPHVCKILEFSGRSYESKKIKGRYEDKLKTSV